MRLSLCVALLALLVGCGGEDPVPRYPVSFYIEADEGQQLSGVEVKANGQSLGASGDTGLVQAMLSGPEGTTFQITYTCPEGHRQPESPKVLTLRSFQGLDPEAQTAGLSMNLECPPATRHVGVVVRATSQAPGVDLSNLAVRVNGEEVARTNALGVAHYTTSATPGAAFRVQIGTDDHANLRPQNPAETFNLPDGDEVFVMSRVFEAEQVERPRPRRSSSSMRSGPRPIGPVPIITRLD